MPSTGTASFTVTCDAMVAAALRVLRIIQEGQQPNSTQLATGREALNVLLKNMQTNGFPIWTYQLIQIPMVAGKYVYTIGPVGADVTNVRPLKLMNGTFLRYYVGGNPFDIPLRVISRKEYFQFGQKAAQGIPNSVYYHPGIDVSGGTTSPSTGYGTLSVYVSPSDTSRTVYGNFQRPIYDVDAVANEFDLPSEWLLPIKWSLAAELADEYEVPEDRIKRVEAKAKFYRDDMADWSVEWAPISFEPDMMIYTQ